MLCGGARLRSSAPSRGEKRLSRLMVTATLTARDGNRCSAPLVRKAEPGRATLHRPRARTLLRRSAASLEMHDGIAERYDCCVLGSAVRSEAEQEVARAQRFRGRVGEDEEVVGVGATIAVRVDGDAAGGTNLGDQKVRKAAKAE